MIQFQQTFTNTEQSKRLLELGVPIDSADIALLNTPDSPYDPYIIGGDMTLRQRLREGRGLPSWSVGRLMEIWEICGNGGRCTTVKKGQSRIEALVKLYEENALYADFSKLEE